jgi:hypothetical protein
VVVQLESEVDFQLQLDNFEGPFDLLLTLIGRHEMDITKVALAKVTDEFLNYVKQLDAKQEMEQVSEFLVVAATLIDLKLASLLPQGEVVDSEDVALLEARAHPSISKLSGSPGRCALRSSIETSGPSLSGKRIWMNSIGWPCLPSPQRKFQVLV